MCVLVSYWSDTSCSPTALDEIQDEAKVIFTESDGDVVKHKLDVSTGSVLLETVGRSEDVPLTHQRASTPPSGSALCRPEAQIGRPGELVHLSELPS